MKTLAWGDFCKHDSPFLHIAYKKYRFSKNRAPFGSARPCFAATSLKFPPHRVVGGNLRCCCSAGFRLRRAFACGELAYLRSCFRCSFLFFFPPASSFSSLSHFLRGSSASRAFLSPPLLLSPPPRPPRPRPSPRKQHTTHVQLSETNTSAAQLSDQNCIG